MSALKLDPRDPEISEVLAKWLRLREVRSELAQLALDREITYAQFVERADDINRDLTDLADELVEFLAPTSAERELHLTLNPA
jgi:hypothetical protein